MSKRSLKNPKFNTTLLLFYVDTRNFLKAIRGNRYHLVPKRGTFHIKTIMLVVKSLICEKLISKPTPDGTIFYHNMLMPLHDSTPIFMNFRRVLDLLEF